MRSVFVYHSQPYLFIYLKTNFPLNLLLTILVGLSVSKHLESACLRTSSAQLWAYKEYTIKVDFRCFLVSQTLFFIHEKQALYTPISLPSCGVSVLYESFHFIFMASIRQHELFSFKIRELSSRELY